MKQLDKNIGLEETHGDHTGEKMVSSEWPLEKTDLELKKIALPLFQVSKRTQKKRSHTLFNELIFLTRYSNIISFNS